MEWQEKKNSPSFDFGIPPHNDEDGLQASLALWSTKTFKTPNSPSMKQSFTSASLEESFLSLPNITSPSPAASTPTNLGYFDNDIDDILGASKTKLRNGVSWDKDKRGKRKDDDDEESSEERRRRNTIASAKFRARKKKRELELKKSASQLEDRVQELTSEAEGLRKENKFLRELVLDSGNFGRNKPETSLNAKKL